MTASMSRRSMIAGATALPAAAMIPAASIAADRTPPDGFHLVVEENGRRWFEADAPDPIFAAIEAHKAANATYSQVCPISSNMTRDDPGYAEADAATEAACHAERDAAIDLAYVAPTTRAGVTALLEYVLEDDRDYPAHEDWPTEITDPDVLDYTGDPAVMPFHFWLLRNVRDALAGIGA